MIVADPVATGIVERLDRPSGNTTGFADLAAHEPELVLPGFARMAAIQPDGPNGGVPDSLGEAKAAFRAPGERPLSQKIADVICST